MRIKLKKLFRILILVLAACSSAFGVIQDTPHDLAAVSGGNSCGYCHTPHSALPGTPLWNHELSRAVYKIYQSSSLEANVGQPTGASKFCLSCHDGTVALGQRVSGGDGGGTYISPGSANLGTDLSDDHPISFIYSDALSAEDPQIRLISVLPEHIKLDRGSELQCTTCHDPHDNEFGDFLVMSNRQSVLCISCHDLRGWSASSHEQSTALVANAEDSYLQDSKFDTVSDNGCASCHRPHSAGGHERLLHFSQSEDNCLNCHNGSVAVTNMEVEILKPSAHDVGRYSGIHDPKELTSSAAKHVECVDCHNPHAAKSLGQSQAPLISGAMKGVTGVTTSGTAIKEAQYQYEVCFKCHGDNPDKPISSITRQITQDNTRLEFSPSNPSFHPVIAPGNNRNVPSLMSPMTSETIIYCTDCHKSDNESGAKGPHGSNYSPLLASNYETDDFTQESSFAYQLCYQCHSRNSILNDESFKDHKKHIRGKDSPCSSCHDAHGINSAQGTVTNNSHLINFDISIVTPDPKTGRLEFVDKGLFKGECFLMCHGKKHSPKKY